MALTKYWYMEAVSVVITPRRSSKGDTCPCTLAPPPPTWIGVPSENQWMVCVTFSEVAVR